MSSSADLDAGDREAKLALVRKFMLAAKKDDEHGILDALEELIASCGEDYSEGLGSE